MVVTINPLARTVARNCFIHIFSYTNYQRPKSRRLCKLVTKVPANVAHLYDGLLRLIGHFQNLPHVGLKKPERHDTKACTELSAGVYGLSCAGSSGLRCPDCRGACSAPRYQRLNPLRKLALAVSI